MTLLPVEWHIGQCRCALTVARARLCSHGVLPVNCTQHRTPGTPGTPGEALYGLGAPRTSAVALPYAETLRGPQNGAERFNQECEGAARER